MKCKLCQLSDEPLCESHIIPEFLFRPSYDEKHRIMELSRRPHRRRWIQQGYKERLLCKGCEQLVNKYETYFKTAWYDKGKCPNRVTSDVVEIDGLDYTLFKLFHLSILWRAGVSREAMFGNVKLGRKHEEHIRKMLLSGEAGAENRYVFVTQILMMNGEVVHAAIMQRVLFRRGEGHHVYRFVFGGCAWNYFVSSQSVGKFLRLALTKEGRLPLTRQEFVGLEGIEDFVAAFFDEE